MIDANSAIQGGIPVEELKRCMEQNQPLVLVDLEVYGSNENVNIGMDLNAISGLEIDRIGDVQAVTDTVIHGRYRGCLGGVKVLIDQFVDLRNCIPHAVVRIITRWNDKVGGTQEDHRNIALVHLKVSDRPKPVARRRATGNAPTMNGHEFCGCGDQRPGLTGP